MIWKFWYSVIVKQQICRINDKSSKIEVANIRESHLEVFQSLGCRFIFYFFPDKNISQAQIWCSNVASSQSCVCVSHSKCSWGIHAREEMFGCGKRCQIYLLDANLLHLQHPLQLFLYNNVSFRFLICLREYLSYKIHFWILFIDIYGGGFLQIYDLGFREYPSFFPVNMLNLPKNFWFFSFFPFKSVLLFSLFQIYADSNSFGATITIRQFKFK